MGTLESEKLDYAIVFGLKNCFRYDGSEPCHSRIFFRKPRKTRFSGHFLQNCRMMVSPEISDFLKNRPVESCLETANLQSQLNRKKIWQVAPEEEEEEDFIFLIV